MALLQPVGRDHPQLLEPLQPLLDVLAELEEIELPPPSFLHVPTLVVGFVTATDISFTEMESMTMRASSHIARMPPFSLRVGGISAREDALYLGVDDDFHLREVRRRAGERAPRIAQALRDDPAFAPDGGDRFMPSIPFAFFTGRGDRARVIEAVEPYRETELGECSVTHISVGRLLSDPQIRYPDPDVILEIALRG